MNFLSISLPAEANLIKNHSQEPDLHPNFPARTAGIIWKMDFVK